MQRSDFHFDLPDELIARYPASERRGSRLLVLQGDQVSHRQFPDLLDYLQPGDLMVFNNTKVIPARLFGHRDTGGKIEVMIERPLNDHEALAYLRFSNTPKPGSMLYLQGGIEARCVERQGPLFKLEFLNPEPLIELLEAHGQLPLPPYMDRQAEAEDFDRYQTVYSQHPGAVAAPTAGLHFDDLLLEQIRSKGIETAFVTLHVGGGTFQPVKVDNLEEHLMHKEWLEVTPEVAEQVRATRQRGGRVIAVGTTSVRCLETASRSGEIQPYTGDTDIFIYPGYEWQCVDMLLTNFHLPESTLLMLVSSFSGYQPIMQAYREAVAENYRFFSYGDAMLLTRTPTDESH